MLMASGLSAHSTKQLLPFRDGAPEEARCRDMEVIIYEADAAGEGEDV
jgi:hypothetical protein